MEAETVVAGNEELFEDTREVLLEEKKRLNPWLILAISLALFVGSMLLGFSIESLVSLVVVLLVHELGHWLGMLLFGYRDLSIFFIPFLGAAASGKKEGAPAWQEATVLLLGPLPGIFVGLGLGVLVLLLDAPPEIVRTMGLWFLGLNAFNLLPVLPLDGGRLFNLLLFCRHHILEVVFMALACLALGGLGVLLDAWVLAFIAFFQLMAIPMRYRVAKTAAGLRSSATQWPHRLDELGDERLQTLFAAAMPRHQAVTPESKALANLMRSIHERILVSPPSLPISLLFLFLYGASWLLVLIGLIVSAWR